MQGIVNPRALVLLPTAVFIIGFGLVVTFAGIDFIGNDGVQYLSTAKGILEGHGIASSAIYYDAQYHFQRIPAPQTIFAPIFPIALSFIGSADESLPTSGIMLNIVFLALCAILIWCLILKHGAGHRVAAVATSFLLCFAVLWQYSIGVLTEPMFCVVMLGCLLATPRQRSFGIAQWALASFLAGLSVGIRFSGILFVAAFLCGLLVLVLLRIYEDRRTAVHSVALLYASGVAAILPIVFILGRNYSLTDSLFARSGSDSNLSPAAIFYAFARSGAELFGYTSNGLLPRTLCIMLFSILFFSILWLMLLQLRAASVVVLKTSITPAVLIGIFFLVNTVAFFIFTTHTSISVNINGRYLATTIPVYLFLTAACLFNRQRPLQFTKSNTPMFSVAVLLLCIFLVGQANAIVSIRTFTHYFDVVDEALESNDEDGPTLSYVLENTCKNHSAPVISNGAQPLHLRSGLPTLGIPMKRYTDLKIGPERVYRHIEDYNVALLVFFPKLYDYYTENDAEHLDLQNLITNMRNDSSNTVVLDSNKALVVAVNRNCEYVNRQLTIDAR